ncbi:hypothetical protein, partial [Neochlamydia sp. AcF95]|uniref:hypothetical protein n=1 Tax=Neochlamydia sp. AcF95 TaxID=2795734 RepID=UPI001BCA5891
YICRSYQATHAFCYLKNLLYPVTAYVFIEQQKGEWGDLTQVKLTLYPEEEKLLLRADMFIEFFSTYNDMNKSIQLI